MPDLLPDRQGLLDQDEHQSHWEYFGRGDREAIALLNGLAMHTKAWYGFLPRLLPELDVVLYDYPGQGASSAHDVPCFIDRIAGYLESVLDEVSSLTADTWCTSRSRTCSSGTCSASRRRSRCGSEARHGRDRSGGHGTGRGERQHDED